MTKELSHVMLELHNVRMKPSNVRKNMKTTKYDKRTITCDVGTAQCENGEDPSDIPELGSKAFSCLSHARVIGCLLGLGHLCLLSLQLLLGLL